MSLHVLGIISGLLITQIPPAKVAVGKFQIYLPATTQGKVGELIILKSESKGEVAWMFDPRDFGPNRAWVSDKEKVLILTTQKPGIYSVSLIEWEEKKIHQYLVAIDLDPNPSPGPNPPAPPTPSKALRVLIVRESGDLKNPQLVAILYGAKVRAYLNSHCVRTDSGPEWRIMDPQTSPNQLSEPLRMAFSRNRNSLPWIVILDDSRVVFEGALPGTEEAVLDLLKRYGG